MNSSFTWPALQLKPQSLPPRLDYERAVWGKVQGASSDFRWIARSAAFNRDGEKLERELALGPENRPCKAFYWRPLPKNAAPGRYLAVVSYPSRAMDFAGRRGFLEKRMLEWPCSPDLPAALGALLLLPFIGEWTDAVWWSRYHDQPWTEPDFALPLEADECAPVACSEEQLVEAIGRGLQAVADNIEPRLLRDWYAQLLSRQLPACLSGLAQPLPPEALAALLLPLPRPLADRLALAGWIPSQRYSLDDLGARWDGLVLPQAAPVAALAVADERWLERAERMAQAVLEQNPDVLATTPAVVVEQSAGAPQLSAGTAPVPAALLDPSQPILPGLTLSLSAPGPNAPSFMHDLYDFARTADRRWLDPAKLETQYPDGLNPLPAQSPEAEALCDWVRQVAEQQPYYADPEQWRVKVDLLRALALVLAPSPTIGERVGLPPQNGPIPALLYAALLKEPQAQEALTALGIDTLAAALQQSRSCRMFKQQVQAAESIITRLRGNR